MPFYMVRILFIHVSSFQSSEQNLTESGVRPGRLHHGGSVVANINLVSSANPVVDRNTSYSSKRTTKRNIDLHHCNSVIICLTIIIIPGNFVIHFTSYVLHLDCINREIVYNAFI